MDQKYINVELSPLLRQHLKRVNYLSIFDNCSSIDPCHSVSGAYRNDIEHILHIINIDKCLFKSQAKLTAFCTLVQISPKITHTLLLPNENV